MECPRCGHATPGLSGRCAACGVAFAHGAVATGVIAVDTTGLPPGGTFGASTGLNPFVATMGGPDGPETGGTAVTSEVGPSPLDGSGPLSVGQAFSPRYHIIKILGVGGMGAVYQAWDAELGVAVALKVIRADRRRGDARPAAEKRFKHELVLARKVTHKNVVRIHDLGEIDGIKYITMPYIQGDDLATVLRRDAKLPIGRALRLAREIAGGLEAAHDAGVVHRDLKPANIMISGAGDDQHALIMDFGISSSADEAADGRIAGTMEYMSPEQGSGQTVDARSDIYAFGLILYEMLVGRQSARTKTVEERFAAMKQRFEDGLPPLHTYDESIPEPLASLVMRCVERDPGARYQTTTELCAALSALDDAGELIPEPARISKRVLRVAILFLLVLLAVMYGIGRRFAPVAPPAHEPVPVLIADFDNRSGDPVFEGSVEQTLAMALEAASYITVFKTPGARALATQLALGKGDRITEEVGQLIARREGIKVMVAGSIDKRGTGYRLELRAIDPANGNEIVTAGQTVRDKSQVQNAIRLMAAKVREALGESKTEMARLTAAETVTAGSLDAMRAFARAQELQQASKFQEAFQEYQRAIDLDPQFGRAYSGMAGVYINYFRQPDKAEVSYQAAMRHLDRMTEREKYRTLGAYYIDIARNYEKAIENFETLVKLYPADDSGHGNLALAYLYVGNLPGAVAEVQKSLEIYPSNSLQRYNYAMFSMYAGDFPTAITEASRVQKENPKLEYAHLPVALSHLAQGDTDGARQAYERLSQMSALGSSFASVGQADLEMYFGRSKNAVALLTPGIAADRTQERTLGLAQKNVALAEAYAALGDRRQAAATAAQAATVKHESTLFPAAIVLLHAGRKDAALQIASTLENMLQRQTATYARLIAGEVALEGGRPADAIEAFRDAQKRQDLWFGRFLMGKAYVQTQHFAEALTELELCLKRRGETHDVFFADLPTARYIPPLYYWLARAQEGTGGTAQARQNYELFLNLRAQADPPDPLAADARRRIGVR